MQLDKAHFKRYYEIYNYNKKITPRYAIKLARAIGSNDFSEYVSDLVDNLIDSNKEYITPGVKSVTHVGYEPVYDLEVEDRHEFICNHFKVHNTVAGSMIFTVFDSYAFYRIKEYNDLARKNGIFTLADMLPPFDIVLSFQNEYALFSNMKIYGVTIVDEGGTMSIDDLMIESTYTWMARGIQPIMSYIPSDIANIKQQQQPMLKLGS